MCLYLAYVRAAVWTSNPSGGDDAGRPIIHASTGDGARLGLGIETSTSSNEVAIVMLTEGVQIWPQGQLIPFGEQYHLPPSCFKELAVDSFSFRRSARHPTRMCIHRR